MKRFFRTKSHLQLIGEADSGEHKLERALGPWHLTLLGVGGIIGAGIFVLTGQASAMYAGPAIVLAYIISGLGCAFAGLCYAEFASMIPVAGSAYTYSYATLGELFAWIIGWDLILEYLFGASTVAVGWSGYVVSFLKDIGVIVPAALCNAPFAYDPRLGMHLTGAILNVPAVLVVAFVTTLLVIGIKQSATFNGVIVLIKLTVILLFVFLGIWFVNPANWHPFVPPNTGDFGHFGWSGVLRGSAVVFFAYIGFDAVSTAAQEAKNPQRDLPRGILFSLAFCGLLYVAVSGVLTGLVPFSTLNVPHPIAVGIDAAGKSLAWLRPLVKLGAIAGLSSVVLVLMLGQTRIFFAMAHDWLLPAGFARIHSRFKTPWIATLVTGVVALVTAGLFPIGILGELVSIGALLAFAMVCAGVLVMRRTKPAVVRPFRTPWVPLVPLLGILFSAVQMCSLPRDTWIRLIAWMFIGLVIYFTYSHRASRLHHANQPPV
ncbi:MAG: amino acid permease [Verrucomicrobia bacterium]|nr:MAG: amino acid permease [Verrucomicrobiota bacterium]